MRCLRIYGLSPSVADRHRFDADPDLTFYFDADLDLCSDPDPYYAKDPRKIKEIFFI